MVFYLVRIDEIVAAKPASSKVEVKSCNRDSATTALAAARFPLSRGMSTRGDKCGTGGSGNSEKQSGRQQEQLSRYRNTFYIIQNLHYHTSAQLIPWMEPQIGLVKKGFEQDSGCFTTASILSLGRISKIVATKLALSEFEPNILPAAERSSTVTNTLPISSPRAAGD